jgi:putative two-component system response regulator
MAENKEIILVVEDDTPLREALAEILISEGFTVLDAANGQEALMMMMEVVPDLILSDISMPVMDGLTFFGKVRERVDWVAVPFIFLTARGERQQVLLGKDLGAEEYLVKPIMADELLMSIRSKLSRSRQLRLVQLRDSYEASLTMLANAIEVRDQYTRGHVERVKAYAIVIAEEIRPEKTFIEAVRFGAILHDIGKIHVRESVLCKTTKLTDMEWNELLQHPVTGAEMIKDIPYLAKAIPVVRYHHERWDGQGYPEKLGGHEIPLSARIVAVADSYDAMTTDRPYRQSIGPHLAYDEIVDKAGTVYDPGVVDAFQTIWAEDRFVVSAD